MVKRCINSQGSMTIPKDIRDALGISGQTMLVVDVRECENGTKEIVMRKSDSMQDTMEKYSKVAELISEITEKTVAVIFNGKLLSMSFSSNTDSFIDKNISINSNFRMKLKAMSSEFIIDSSKSSLLFSDKGIVLAYYKIPNTDVLDRAYFVILDDAKSGSDKVSKIEEMRRYNIVAKIVSDWS